MSINIYCCRGCLQQDLFAIAIASDNLYYLVPRPKACQTSQTKYDPGLDRYLDYSEVQKKHYCTPNIDLFFAKALNKAMI